MGRSDWEEFGNLTAYGWTDLQGHKQLEAEKEATRDGEAATDGSARSLRNTASGQILLGVADGRGWVPRGLRGAARQEIAGPGG